MANKLKEWASHRRSLFLLGVVVVIGVLVFVAGVVILRQAEDQPSPTPVDTTASGRINPVLIDTSASGREGALPAPLQLPAFPLSSFFNEPGPLDTLLTTGHDDVIGNGMGYIELVIPGQQLINRLHTSRSVQSSFVWGVLYVVDSA